MAEATTVRDGFDGPGSPAACGRRASLLGAAALVVATACGGSPGSDTPALDASTDGTAPGDGAIDGRSPSVTGVDLVLAGEYVTSFVRDGRVYTVSGTAARRGAGPNPPNDLYPLVETALPPDVQVVAGAGGLHFTIVADAAGHVWEWGDIAANPALETSTVPVQLTTSDGAPFVLPGGVRSMAASVTTSVAVAGDGSVYIWDDCASGRAGDGTDGDAHVLHPRKVPLPADADIVKVAIGDVVIALGADGRVWTWGAEAVENLGTNQPDFRAPHQLTTTSAGTPLPPIIDIATGQSYAYALAANGDLFVWGFYAEIAGLCATYCPQPTPRRSNELLAAATAGGARATQIHASFGGSYAVMSDGTLWGWGTNGQGLVGDGHEPDYATTPMPYAWDWDRHALLVSPAVRIAPGVDDVVRVFTGSALVFYAYALTADGRLYSWGRNKTGNLGSGVVPLNSHQAATYPNSWDVTVPTEVDPFAAPNTPVASPHCLAHPDAPNCWCGAGPSDPQGC
ncbi:MAG: hypothetical protein R3B06_15025 [Kofleriaceae bacterium]